MRVTRRTMLGGLVSSGLWTPFSASTEPLFPSDRNGGTSNGVQAERIASFLDIIGVNGHIGSNGTPYLNIKGIVADTAYIGARKWRDSLRAQNSWQLEPLKALVSAGLSLIGVPLHSQTIAVDDHITRARVWAGLGTNALLALDGPNEPGNFPFTYKGVSVGTAGHPITFLPVAEFCRDYYAAIKADPVLYKIPLWSTSLGGAEPDNVGIQYLAIPASRPAGVLVPAGTIYADVANIHVYPMYDGGPQTMDARKDRIWINLKNNFVETYAKHFHGYTQAQAQALAKVATEYGYQTVGVAPNSISVDETTQSKCLLSGLFNFYDQDYSTVNIYQLYDFGGSFGLFYDTAHPKPSAKHLHNLTAVLADNGATARTFPPVH